jgi:hypothetical protein
LFDLTFNEPQNFAQYRQADIDSARIATFTQLEAYPYFSKRWLMKRYLGMTEQELSDNETSWNEEQGDVESAPAENPSLRGAGISPGGIESDLGDLETGGEGMPAGPDAGGEVPAAGGAEPAL